MFRFPSANSPFAWTFVTTVSLCLSSAAFADAQASAATTPSGTAPPSASETAAPYPATKQPKTDIPKTEDSVPAHACSALNWKLTGASAVASDEADFSEAWRPVLSEIAECAKTAAFGSGCLNIRGHYDELEFKGAQEVVGGRRSAQRLRAASRAARLAHELRLLGASDAVLRSSLAPYDFATYRGVHVEFVPNCRPQVISEIADEVVRRIQHPAPEYEGTGSPPADAAVDTPQPPFQSGEKQETPQANSLKWGVWLEEALALNGIYGLHDWETSRAFIPELHLGGGLRLEDFYVRGTVSLQTGFAPEQRMGTGFSFGAGYRLSDWLQGGLRGSYQNSTLGFREPVLDSYWSLGLEFHQCVVKIGPMDLCAWEAFELVGSYTIRAEVTDGNIERIPNTHTTALGLTLGAVLRQEFAL